MRAGPILLSAVLLAFILTAPTRSLAVTAPEARGLLSLAWDEMESGRYAEALKYIESIDVIEDGDAQMKEDAAWMRADCLLTLERYDEAVTHLSAMDPATAVWRDDFLMETAYQWSANLTQKGDYQGAIAAVKRVESVLPRSLALKGLAEVTRNRHEIEEMVKKGRGGRLSAGGELKLVPAGKKPGGPDWVRACPPEDEDWAVFEEDCGKWLAQSPTILEGKRLHAWVRVPAGELKAAIKKEAGRLGMTTGDDGINLLFRKKDYLYPAERAATIKRVAVEGLGISGAALIVAAEAERNLDLQDELAGWMKARLGTLTMTVGDGSCELTQPKTGRITRFYLSEWVEYFSGDEPGWTKLWEDVSTELMRAKKPYTCFCGKPMLLRQALASSAEGLISAKHGHGLHSVIIAACPDHWLMVSGQTLKEWGVSKEEVFGRAEKEAVDSAWDVTFERFKSNGAEYTVFSGTGISGLAEKPGLMLGLLTALEGKDIGERTIFVLATSPDSLVVGLGDITEEAGREGARKAAMLGTRQRGMSGLMNFKEAVKLPKRPEGVFNLTVGK